MAIKHNNQLVATNIHETDCLFYIRHKLPDGHYTIERAEGCPVASYIKLGKRVVAA
jgi:hypothetical protein